MKTPMESLYKKLSNLQPHQHLQALALFAAVLVVSAFVIEHGFGAKPCHLCWLQRYGHWAVLLFAFVGCFLPSRRGQFMALLGVAAATVYGFFVGAYHVLVQAKLVQGPSGCSGASPLPADLESFNAFLKNPILPPRCDEVNFTILGLSLSAWNVIAMVFLAVAVYHIYKRWRTDK